MYCNTADSLPFDAYYTIGVPISLGQSMKPGIYATKKAIALITIAMVRMIRSSLVIPANMTQDGSISLEYAVENIENIAPPFA